MTRIINLQDYSGKEFIFTYIRNASYDPKPILINTSGLFTYEYRRSFLLSEDHYLEGSRPMRMHGYHYSWEIKSYQNDIDFYGISKPVSLRIGEDLLYLNPRFDDLFKIQRFMS